LTPTHSKAAVMSSFDVKILMQDDRRPFFYYFRVLQSHPLRMRNFPESDVWTTKELNVMIDQLKNVRPAYVFLERVLLQDVTPAQRAADDPAVIGLLDYVKSHYRPYAFGEFLAAMKLNTT
jgi:hypothetical protein